MKDNFSGHADQYAIYRPEYPPALAEWLASLAPARRRAWDVGTGNGQLALLLANHFEAVEATDISARQLAQAPPHPRLSYSEQPAERTTFPDGCFDLVAVAQAVHWFQFEAFYAEVKRVLAPNGVLALVGYGLLSTFPEADAIIGHFYRHEIGPYWDPERRYIDERYQTLPFPLRPIAAPELYMEKRWTFDQLIGYLATWSAVKHYEKARSANPLALIQAPLAQVWGTGARQVRFELLLRAGQF